MKKWKLFLFSCLCGTLAASALHAEPSAKDKDFIARYKAALEAHDVAKLESFLYTKDANPIALDFFQSTLQKTAKAKIGIVDLEDLTPSEVQRLSQPQTSPSGIKTRLPLTPTKKLKVMTYTTDSHGVYPSWRYNYVAEYDGNYVIPVPVTAK